MCGIRQAVHVQLPVEEGNGKPPPLICTSQVYDGTSEMTIPSRTCLMAENSSSSSSTQGQIYSKGELEQATKNSSLVEKLDTRQIEVHGLIVTYFGTMGRGGGMN